PEWLTLLHGVIDSPDIPLNVSRSYLQADGQVKKISNHISKKVSDKLNEMFKLDRPDFESKWEDIKLFIEYGMLSDEKFFDRIQKSALYKEIDGGFHTWEELGELIKSTQTNKDKKTVVLYASNVEEQYTYIKAAQDRGYKVIHLDGPLASHVVSKLEQTSGDFMFARVDSDTVDKLIQTEDAAPSKLSDDEKGKLKPVFEGLVEKEKFMVQFEPMDENAMPIMITQAEFMRRMREQQQAGGGAMWGAMPEMFNLVVNENHPIIGGLIDTADTDDSKAKISQLIDLAMLSQGLLKGEKLTAFVKRSVDILK
ncbi:MAG: molecular chaperone HtpG, partial [Luteibaculaceae bacterium]